MRLLLLAILVAVLLPVISVAQEERRRCETCGMNYDISPTRVDITVEHKKKSTTHIYECLNCGYRAITAKYGDTPKIIAVSMLNYQTFGTKKEAMVDGLKAFYLYGVKRMRATMPPFIVAYEKESDAKSAQRVLDGELVSDFDTIWKMLKEHNTPKAEDNDK